MKRIVIILNNGETIVGSPYKDKKNRPLPLFTYPESPSLKDFAMLDDVMALHGIETDDIARWHIEKVEG